MNTYSVFGYYLLSSLQLPLLKTSGEAPDIVVQELDRERYRRELRAAQQRGISEDLLSGHFRRRLYYLTEGGHSITFCRAPGFADDLAAQCMIGIPLAVALRQRGILTLHACAVAKEGRAVAFLGHSGAGKSTLAEVFSQHGYEVLTDDLLAIRFEDGQPIVLPGPPQIRLREGSGTALLPDYEALPRSWEEGDQRLRLFLERERVPVPLARLYFIDGEDAPETSIEPVDPQEAVLAMMRQTWAFNVFTEAGYAGAHIQHLAALVRRGHVARLRRVRSLEVVSEYVEVVEADLAARSGHEPVGRAQVA